MKGRNMFIRVVAIILCAIMVLGVVTVAFYAFAADADAVTASMSPDTGSESMVWVIAAVVAAVAVIAGCLIIPKMKK